MTTGGRLLLISLVAGLAAGADSSVPTQLRGPVLGYVLDARSQSVRPINGIPGAARIADPLPVPFPVAAAAFSSRSDFAVLVSADEDRGVFLLKDAGATPSLEPLVGGIAAVDRIALNAADSAAALYSAATRQLQIVRGLPADPQAGPALDLSSLPGAVTALALDRAASGALVAVSEGGRGALYRITEGPEPVTRILSDLAAPSAIALLNQDRGAVIADAAFHEVILLWDFAAGPEMVRLAGERDGISRPIGLALSVDQRKLFIAAGDRKLHVFDLDTRVIEARFELDAVPTRLDRLQGASTFLINDAGDEPLLLFDTVESPAIYFVPARRGEQ
jgi:hypothetical protein